MGNSASVLSDADQLSIPQGICIHGATGLRDADFVPGSGESDPYCVARIGSVGSSWADKALACHGLQWSSSVVYNQLNPAWEMHFVVDLGADWAQIVSLGTALSGEGLELQVSVYDEDAVSFDQLLGCIIVPFPANGVLEKTAFPLTGAARAKGSVSVSFSRPSDESGVNAACDEQQVRNGERSGGFSLGEVADTFLTTLLAAGESGVDRWAGRIATWGTDSGGPDPGPDYFADCAKLATGNFPDLLNAASHDGGLTAQNAVGGGSTSILTHAECAEKLAALPAQWAAGEAFRGNDLGYARLNHAIWEDGPVPGGMAIGAAPEVHAVVRPLLDSILGKSGGWSQAQIASRCGDYLDSLLEDGLPLRVGYDVEIFLCVYLHDLALGWDLPVAEARTFLQYMKRVLVSTLLPAQALKVPAVARALKLREAKKYRLWWIERAAPLVRARYELAEEQVELFCSALLDGLTFAGIPGGSASIINALGVLHSPTSPYAERTSLTEAQLPLFVLETMRLYAPVKAFSYYADSSQSQRTLLWISVAMRDPRVWGADADQFRLRPPEQYASLQLSWANPAVDLSNADGRNNRFCPAKDLSFTLAVEFLRAFLSRKDQFRLREGEGEDIQMQVMGKSPMLKSAFTLYTPYRDGLHAEDGLPAPPSAADFLGGLPSLEALAVAPLRYLETLCDVELTGDTEVKDECDEKALRALFNRMDGATKLLYTMATKIVSNHTLAEGGFRSVSDICLPKKCGALDRRDFEGIPGYWVPCSDEDSLPKNLLAKALSAVPTELLMRLLTTLRQEDLPVPFASPRQAKAFHDLFFSGALLPAPSAEFGVLTADSALSRVAFYGMGQFLLRRYEGEGVEGVEGGGELYCVDTTELGRFAVRRGFEQYGARAVFDKEGELLSIYTCAQDRVLRPPSGLGASGLDASGAGAEREEWAHAKWIWKCSLTTHITADAHLCQTHWLIANNAHIATRTCLHKDHPLRRVLKVFTFNTGSINHGSTFTLFPAKGILHRITAFTYPALHSVLKVCMERFQYCTIPQMVAAKKLGPELLQRLPLALEGLELWALYVRFFHAYLTAFLPDDAAVCADAEIASFWRTVDSCGGRAGQGSYGLPPLSLGALVDYLAHVAFGVSAQHELVGEVVQYNAVDASSTSIRAGAETQDAQGYVATMVLTALTGLRNPSVMDDWRHLLPAEPSARAPYAELMAGMEALAGAIEERNQTRVQQCNSFNPRHLECSVSV